MLRHIDTADKKPAEATTVAYSLAAIIIKAYYSRVVNALTNNNNNVETQQYCSIL